MPPIAGGSVPLSEFLVRSLSQEKKLMSESDIIIGVHTKKSIVSNFQGKMELFQRGN